MLPHRPVESFFSRVAKRRMPDIVNQPQSFGQVIVEPKLGSDGARNLRNFERVGQAVSKMVRIAARENLRLRLKTSKSARMNDAVPVSLEVIAVGMRRLGVSASARVFYTDSVGGENGIGGQVTVPVPVYREPRE
jgi:hypothetical protein